MIRAWSLVLIVSLRIAGPAYSQEAEQVSAMTADQVSAMTTDDILDLVGMSDAEISPDGEWILYSRSDLKWGDNKRESYLWMVSADGADHFQFTSHAGDGSAGWSPDGRMIAFLSSRKAGGGVGDEGDENGGGRQIWLIRTRGGEAWQLTEHDGGVSAFEWSPDGHSIVFRASDTKSKEEKEAEEGGDDAIYVDEGPNGQGRRSWSNLWTISIDDRTERQITSGDWAVAGFAISPDGKTIAFHARRERERNNGNLTEIYTVGIVEGEIERLTDNRSPESGVKWSPDGRSISYTAAHDAEWELYNRKIRIMEVDTKVSRVLTDGYDGNIGTYEWSPDGSKVLFAGQHRTMNNLFEVDAESGAVKQLTEEEGVFQVSSFSADRKRAAALYETPQTPRSLYLLDRTTLKRTELVDLNPDAESFEMPRAEVVRWKSKDGTEIEGVLHLPHDYQEGTRLPFILSIHGGPAGVWRYNFNSSAAVLTGLGYAVLSPNVRGSSGYSDALLRGNLNDIGGGDYWDAMTGVDAMIDRGIADPERLAVRGWSYGGILGGWAITQTDRFKAASLGAMVADWTSEYAMGFNNDIRYWYIGGTPWENPEGYRRQSAFTYIDNVSTPTILFHGERDTTDTIGQSMIFYQGLKDRGVDTRFIRFPREPHGFREPRHQRIRDIEEIAWFEKYVRGRDFEVTKRTEEQDEEEEEGSTKTDGSPNECR